MKYILVVSIIICIIVVLVTAIFMYFNKNNLIREGARGYVIKPITKLNMKDGYRVAPPIVEFINQNIDYTKASFTVIIYKIKPQSFINLTWIALSGYGNSYMQGEPLINYIFIGEDEKKSKNLLKFTVNRNPVDEPFETTEVNLINLLPGTTYTYTVKIVPVRIQVHTSTSGVSEYADYDFDDTVFTFTTKNTITPTITQTMTNTITPTMTNTITPTMTNTITPTMTNTITPTITQTMTNTITPTMTNTITPTFTQTGTPTMTNTITPTFTQTRTPTMTYTGTPTMTQTITPTFTQTGTPTMTNTITPTFTQTGTPTMTNTITPTFTQTGTPTMSKTGTPTMSKTGTPTMSKTGTPTMTNTITPTMTQTPLPVNLPQPINNTVKVPDIEIYYIGQIIVFPDGSVYIITDIIPDNTSAFANHYDAFLNQKIIEGISISGTLILRPIKVVTPSITKTLTQSNTPTQTNELVVQDSNTSQLKRPSENRVSGPSNAQDSLKSKVGSIAKGLDTLFHDTIEDIKEQSNAYFPQSKSVSVTDVNGNKIKIEIPKQGAGFTYYEPGSYKYSADSYVPDYEDSIVLSRSIGLVPRLKGEFFISADTKKLNSIETDYNSSDSLITSSNWSAITPSGTMLSGEKTDNVANGQAEEDIIKKNKLLADISIGKTAEELEYEDKVADLLAIQTGIYNYATPAPMNVQTKIPIIGITTMDKISSTNKNKGDVFNKDNLFYNYATPAPMNVETKIPVVGITTMDKINSINKNKGDVFKKNNLFYNESKNFITKAPTVSGPYPSILQKNKNDVFKIGAGSPLSTNYLLMTSDQ
uniref:Uncharacterized protein n=1 Tax=viral metagenome TaxID=1070528 RepID=A0A6C0B758_9ZZZZ